MLIVVCELGIEEDDQGIHRLRVVDQIGGPQTLLPQVCTFQKADTPERLDRFLARVRAYGPFMEANIGILREGLETGLTAPRIVAERTIAQLERLLAIPIEQAVVPSMAQVASEADRERVREVVRDVVYPADASFLAALRDEYFAATRVDPGLWSAPAGDVLYRTQIRGGTTLDLDPTEVHRIGLDELESIEAERRTIARAAGFGDDTTAYRRAIEAEPRNHAQTPEELLERAREDIERGLAAAPRYFGRLPRAALDVKAVERFKEKDAPFAYYFPPSVDGSRPGTYYANTYDLPSRTYMKLATTTYHEAVPGHHFQIALEMENPDSDDVPAAWLEAGGRRLRRGLGRVRRAAGRRDGTLPRRGRAVRDARRAGVARRPARRRYGPPRPALVAPAVDRRPAGGGHLVDRCGDRDGPVHRLARPGPDLQDRAARDRATSPRALRPRRVAVRPPGLPRPGPRSRLGAARDARPRAAELGRRAGLKGGASKHRGVAFRPSRSAPYPPCPHARAIEEEKCPTPARVGSGFIVALAGAATILASTALPAAAANKSGFKTKQAAMLDAAHASVDKVVPLITVGERRPGGYRFEAIPDGISFRTRGNGRVDVYINHETSLVPFPYTAYAAANPGATPPTPERFPTKDNSQNDFDNSQLSRLVLNRKSKGILEREAGHPERRELPAVLLELHGDRQGRLRPPDPLHGRGGHRRRQPRRCCVAGDAGLRQQSRAGRPRGRI